MVKASILECPKVSIGMPVFNGEKYIKTALDSILAQTYTAFELIIMDNASFDNTPKICLEYVSKDSRIRYVRNNSNIGATRNFNKVFKISKGEYFKWASHDDVLAPDFLEKCVQILEKNPSIILCHSITGRIDGHGKLTGTYEYTNKIDSLEPSQRFGAIINDRHNSWVLSFGLIRSSSLRKTQLYLGCVNADLILLAELSLIGRMHKIPECLFLRRSHPEAYTESMYQSGVRNSHEKLNWWILQRKINFPSVKLCSEYIKLTQRAKLNLFEKISCYKHIIIWFLKVGWLLIIFDVGINLLGRSRLGLIFYNYSLFLPKFIRSRIKRGTIQNESR